MGIFFLLKPHLQTDIERKSKVMAEENLKSELPGEVPAPAITTEDTAVDGLPSQTAATPQKDTVMADAPAEQPAVSQLTAEIRCTGTLTTI